MIHNIFSIPLYNTKLSIDNKPILSYCTSLAKRNKGRVMTNVGGWQSNDLNGVHKPLNELLEDIDVALKRLDDKGLTPAFHYENDCIELIFVIEDPYK